MYETFYGLRERPFSLLPDPDYLYLSPKHMRALTLLEYGMMNQAGFSVICGDTGAGKTTLLRRLLSELGEDTTVGLITNTHKSFGELLSWILMAFGLDGENRSKASMHQMLIEFLIDQYAQNRHTVLIVDEAQNMTADTLEELRMLSNINSDKDQVLQVILAGQPALRETLRKPELMQFAQRIAVDYYLESLNRDETCEYIQHRLDVAGGSTDIFTEAACHAIYRYSGGTPRLINLLCDTALVYGFAEQTPVIDVPLIEDVVREQHRNSIVPTFNKPLNEDISRPQQSPDRPAKRSRTRVDAQVTTRIETPVMHVIEEDMTETELEVASLSQKASSDYKSAMHIGHADNQGHATASEPVINKAHSVNEQFTQDDEPHAPVNKVTRINKSTVKKSADTTDVDSAPFTSPQPLHKTTDQPQHTEKRRLGDKSATDHVTDHNASAANTADSASPESLEPKFDEEDTNEQTPYKDVYPIVHIADEPKKNINVLILGILGGMVLSLLMFITAWMMFHNETPPVAAVTSTTPPQAEVSSTVSVAEQTRIAAMERERDEAKAATEALIRERDAALATAQKQEAIRAAEKRANEIIAAQERKYASEMERVRQRAFDAEVAAAKARERERFASEDAERARQEASRTASSPPASAVTAQPAAVISHVEPETKPVATNTKSSTPANSDSNTQFSTNPCNTPSAKFLSTCKK